MDDREIQLKIAEAYPDDVGKGIVRIDASLMKEIGIRPGSVVEIEGNRKTVAIVDRSLPADVGLKIIRMDGIPRFNAKAGIGELVKVRPVQVVEAKQVTIAPADQGLYVQVNAETIKRALLGRAVMKGDVISLGGTNRRKRTMSGSPFEDIFRMLEEDFFTFGISEMKFVVTNSAPKGAVLITDQTSIDVSSQAVEMKETKIPDITYEDIGGLEEEVKKVRELVEIPLRHPEIFKRLGVDPPKGILLFGPPGCGKTLLAKAVASESEAHFISLNGPEVMCVSGDTKLLLNPDGYETAEQLFARAEKTGRKLLRSPETFQVKGLKSFSINKEGKLVPSKITHITKLEGEGIEVELSDGEKVIVSKNQPFLVINKLGELEWKRCESLNKDDWVAKAGRIKTDFDSQKLKKPVLTKSIKPIKIPKTTSKELLEFLGFMMSEGSIPKRLDDVEFANNNKELRDRFVVLSKKLFNINDERIAFSKDKLSIHSKQLTEFLTQSCSLESGKKKNMRLPQFIFRCPEKEVAAFLRAYFEGDGRISKGTIKYPTIKYYCSSNEFLKEMQALLQLRFGIKSNLVPWKTKISNMHALVIKDSDATKMFIKKIGALTDKKKELLSKMNDYNQCRSSEFLPDIKNTLKEIKNELKVRYEDIKSYNGYFYGNKRLTRPVLAKIITLLQNNGVNQKLINLKKLMNDSVEWVQIKNKKDIGKQTLYDFSVEKHENFVAGPLLLLHNSKWVGEAEKKLREVFDEAEKNAPTIVFIDEIDAIAPKREEVTGEVERRVVAQLLGLMDGMKSRGKVIVIAATNRQNAIDPALRRPGRFDREIEIGVPDKESRLKILKIHTRNMPLTEDVNLEELADITYGFVGADLNALCKEAAMNVLRRVLSGVKLKNGEQIPNEILEKLKVGADDFRESLKLVNPSGMREVMIEVPNVKWEDIGGLSEVIQQLKESVEWPLKNPDAFRRMGIKPPRGIMLYGPPGCGKTLLAKAVAKESKANFISVKGPEIFSKWVGESLPYDEKILIQLDDKIKRIKIGELVESGRKEGVKVAAFNDDFTVEFLPIENLIKHERKDRNLVELTTKTGRKITVTQDHSLFTLKDDEVVSVKTSELIPDESFIAIPDSIPIISKGVRELDLIKELNTSKIFVQGAKSLIKEFVAKHGYKQLSKQLGISLKYSYALVSKEVPISINNFKKILKILGKNYNPKKLSLSVNGCKNNFLALLTLDDSFLEFLGLWIAEGDYNSTTVRITNTNKEIKNSIKKMCKAKGLSFTETKTTITINSVILQIILKQVFGLETGASKKKVPEIIFNLNKKQITAFLRGYYSGEGSIYENMHRYYIESGSISKELTDDITYLLLFLGIVATIDEKKERTGTTTFRTRFSSVDNFKKFMPAGFIDTKRNELIRKYTKDKKWKRSIQIPLSNKLKNFITKHKSQWNFSETIGKDILRKILIELDPNHKIFRTYWKLVTNSIYWDKVKSVKKVKSKLEYVYDISVPKTQNFVGGYGGVFAHNSEKAIREIFRKARQVAPCIIFFDEIDAIAPKRGRDSGTHVTEQVVNQILSEMDGLEELIDVVVIAATNRPDIVDSALLRPGRFDRLILVPPPDYESRLKIFKIHTKKMPLEKDVNIEDYAKKTEFYSGADIQNLCKEAGMIALRRDIKADKVTGSEFDKVMKDIEPSLNEDDMKVYKSFTKRANANRKASLPDELSYMG